MASALGANSVLAGPLMPKRDSQLLNTNLAVFGAHGEFATDASVHLASVGARLFLTGGDEQKLLEADALLSQSEIHRVLPETDPNAIATWLIESALPLGGVIAFTSAAPNEAHCRTLFTPLAEQLPKKHAVVPALVVHATRPGTALDGTAIDGAPALNDLQIGNLRIGTVCARNVVSTALLEQLGQAATASGRARDEHLADLFGGTLPKPLFTGRDLGGLVETLLGSFSLFSRGRHFEFDGAP